MGIVVEMDNPRGDENLGEEERFDYDKFCALSRLTDLIESCTDAQSDQVFFEVQRIFMRRNAKRIHVNYF